MGEGIGGEEFCHYIQQSSVEFPGLGRGLTQPSDSRANHSSPAIVYTAFRLSDSDRTITARNCHLSWFRLSSLR